MCKEEGINIAKSKNDFELVIHYADEESSKSKEYLEDELCKWFELILKSYPPSVSPRIIE